MSKNVLSVLSVLFGLLWLTGCAYQVPRDYTNFKESKPRSILVLMPTSSVTNIEADENVLGATVLPLSLAGYYVFPVTMVYDTFKENGLTEAADIQAVPLEKLNEVFNPDAVLYLSVNYYNADYTVLSSSFRVQVTGKLVDAKNGKLLWSMTMNSKSNGSSGGNLLAQVISALVTKIVNELADVGYDAAGMNAQLMYDPLLQAYGNYTPILYGPYHPKYQEQFNLIVRNSPTSISGE